MYEKISANEINEAARSDPTRAMLMIMANSIADDAASKSAGEIHVPELRKDGWSIAIETPRGIVGLWSCWLGDRFFLGYPKDVTVPDISELIIDNLGVSFSTSVPQVGATAVTEGYSGPYKDADKPLIVNRAGQTVAFRSEGLRRWAKFYSERVNGNEGRVWVDHSDHDMYGHHFDVIRLDGTVEDVYYGHNHSWGVKTEPFSFWNQYDPDGPTADPEAIQPYRDKFIALACAIATRMGGAMAVNINYGFVIVPEQASQLGYEFVNWGSSAARFKKDGDQIVLREGNSLDPWSTLRRIETPSLTPEELIGLLTF